MPSGCEHLAAALPVAGRGEARDPTAVRAHAATCLRCRLELARWQRLFRLLDQLAEDRLDVPPGLLAEVLSAIESAAKQSARRTVLTGRRVAGVLACLGAALTGVLVVRGRGATGAGAVGGVGMVVTEPAVRG